MDDQFAHTVYLWWFRNRTGVEQYSISRASPVSYRESYIYTSWVGYMQSMISLHCLSLGPGRGVVGGTLYKSLYNQQADIQRMI